MEEPCSSERQEEFRQIEGFENYSVSNLGNVRNDKTGRILKPGLNTQGYFQVDLCKDSKKKTYRINRLVGLAFIDNPDNLKEIDHINQIKTDNRIENLRWCSRSNNQRNRKKWEGTSSKFLGVCWNNQKNKWRACIRLNCKEKHLGYFLTEEEAYEAWLKAVEENNLQEYYGL